MDELGYLANVLVAGAGSGARGREPLRPLAAAEAALATVALGAELAAQAARDRKPSTQRRQMSWLRSSNAVPPMSFFAGPQVRSPAKPAWAGGSLSPPQPELAEVLPSLTQRPARAGARSR